MAHPQTVAVLGGGNGAFIHAADLALRGLRVNLVELPQFEENIRGIEDRGEIELEVLGNIGLKGGLARLNLVTTRPEEALRGAKIVFVVVPAFGQKGFARAAAQHFSPEQLVILEPGNFGGALEFAQILKDAGLTELPVLCEAECMLYSGFKKDPRTAQVSGFKRGLFVAAFPGQSTAEAVTQLSSIAYPDVGFKAGRNVLETGLRNLNFVGHPPITILNAGRIEFTKGDFLFYWHGATPSVGRVIEDLDAERLAVGKALGLDLPTIVQVLMEWYAHLGAKGNTVAEIQSTNPVYEIDWAPKSLHHRFLLEDIPYGLVPLETLGELTHTQTPITTALTNLASSLLKMDLRKDARNLRALGLEGLTLEQLNSFLDTGIKAQKR